MFDIVLITVFSGDVYIIFNYLINKLTVILVITLVSTFAILVFQYLYIFVYSYEFRQIRNSYKWHTKYFQKKKKLCENLYGRGWQNANGPIGTYVNTALLIGCPQTSDCVHFSHSFDEICYLSILIQLEHYGL